MKNNLFKRIYRQSIAVFLFTFVVISLGNAQSANEEVDYYQSIFGMEKKVAMAEFLEIDEDAAFWSVYDMYETKRKELGKKRLELLVNYADNYVGMGDEAADDLVKQMQAQKKNLDKLIYQYYKKIKKTSGSKVAAQFYQFENYILSAIRLEVLESIPLIGEWE